MKNWDLKTAAGKIEMSLKSLRTTQAAVGRQWNDEAFRTFQEKHLLTVEPNARGMIDAIAKLNEVLVAAERQCGEEHD
ncbi:MAG: WXG100 family type VII secretion target [Pirellulales bacterium]|nr:WXG100 family type VII secretion target [Pirellulales bacterium]